MTNNLPYEPPLDWAFLLDYMEKRRTEGVEMIDGDHYRRAIRVNGDSGILSVQNDPKKSQLVIDVQGDVRKHVDTISVRVRQIFDLDASPRRIRERLAGDPLVGPLCEAYPGIRIPGAWCPFELLVRTIVGQQVSVAAATTIMGRIVQRTGRPVAAAFDAKITRLFPTPESIATADLSAIGMPARRVEALQHVAARIAQGSIAFPRCGATAGAPCGSKPSAKSGSIIESLLDLPGIGPWTASYFALRALRDADAWPQTDLVIRRMLNNHPLARTRTVRSISDSWRPYRGYAAMHLWHAASLADKR